MTVHWGSGIVKKKEDEVFLCFVAVAPYAGAWIEIKTLRLLPLASPVAPYAGAWIEIRIICIHELK